ncbi:MAG: hypothetical protein BWY51_00689 [Parcubacteria group bacterium ADurb.Bin316]|nr:MAG: hypothetical protein BWY51_00689 [Parcubacteria group bacterium ADurb.Bin316]HOZ55644.1 hypothetical protein [bacterium]
MLKITTPINSNNKILSSLNIYRLFFWIFLSLLTVLLHSKHYIDIDEGHVLDGAWNLLNGKKLYFDFFEFTPPGAYYLVLWLWQIFGVNYLVAKIASLAALLLAALGIYKIWSAVSRYFNISRDSVSIYLSIFIFIISTTHLPTISYHTFNLAFTVWAVYFFIKALSIQPNKNIIFFSGLLTGAAALFMQNKGGALFLTLFLFTLFLLIKERKKIWLQSLLILSVATTLPIITLAAFWPVGLLFKNLIAFPIFNYTKVAMVPFYLLFFFIIVWTGVIWLLRKKTATAIQFLFFWQFILLFSIYSLADHAHLLLAIFPLLALLPAVLNEIKTSIYKNYFFILTVVTIFIIVYPALVFLNNFKNLPTAKDYKFLDYIAANCDKTEYLYAGPFMCGIYFETRKINPTPYGWLITNHHTDDQFTDAKEKLEINTPACAILNYQLVKKYGYNIDNPVDNFIKENYYLAYTSNDVMVYKKNQPQ